MGEGLRSGGKAWFDCVGCARARHDFGVAVRVGASRLARRPAARLERSSTYRPSFAEGRLRYSSVSGRHDACMRAALLQAQPVLCHQIT